MAIVRISRGSFSSDQYEIVRTRPDAAQKTRVPGHSTARRMSPLLRCHRPGLQ